MREDSRVLSRCDRWLEGVPGLGALQLVRRIFNAVVLTDGRSYVKLGYRQPNRVALEFRFSEALRQGHPDLARFLPDWSFHALPGGRHCIVGPRLQQMGATHSPNLARQVLSAFWAEGRQRAAAEPTSQALDGVRLAQAWCRGLSPTVLADAMSRSLHWGPAHGDFHAGNVLCDERGTPVVIDLDCVRLDGPQVFDWLYFNVEWQVARSGAGWIDVLAEHLEGRLPDVVGADAAGVGHRDPAVILAFLLDRLGQEAKYGIRPDPARVARCVSLALSRMTQVTP